MPEPAIVLTGEVEAAASQGLLASPSSQLSVARFSESQCPPNQLEIHQDRYLIILWPPYIHTQTDTHLQLFIPLHTHQLHIPGNMYTYMLLHIHTHKHTNTHMPAVHFLTYILAYTWEHVYTYITTHTHIETHRHTHTQTHKHTSVIHSPTYIHTCIYLGTCTHIHYYTYNMVWKQLCVYTLTVSDNTMEIILKFQFTNLKMTLSYLQCNDCNFIFFWLF